MIEEIFRFLIAFSTIWALTFIVLLFLIVISGSLEVILKTNGKTTNFLFIIGDFLFLRSTKKVASTDKEADNTGDPG